MRTTLRHGAEIELDRMALRARLSAFQGALGAGGDAGATLDPDSLRPASVLVPVIERAEFFTVLFTQRTAHLRNHSGQVSFPGGRDEPSDDSPEATALREAEEEIGLDPATVEVVARLDEYRTGTGFRITPVVGFVRPPFALRPDPGEVDSVFEVPLSFLLDPANHGRRSAEFQGRAVTYWNIEYLDRTIWGATAGMIVNLYRRLALA